MLIQRLQLLYVYTNLILDVYTSSAVSPCGPHEHRRLSAYLQVVDFTRVGAVLSCTSPLPRVFSFSCFLVGDQRSIDGCEGCEPLLSLSLSLSLPLSVSLGVAPFYIDNDEALCHALAIVCSRETTERATDAFSTTATPIPLCRFFISFWIIFKESSHKSLNYFCISNSSANSL